MNVHKEQNFVYFVSFAHTQGFDSVEVFLTEEINNINMIAGISKDIEKNIGVSNVNVINFILLRIE